MMPAPLQNGSEGGKENSMLEEKRLRCSDLGDELVYLLAQEFRLLGKFTGRL